MRYMNTQKSQAALEYIGFIVMIAIALLVISMRSYLVRAVQGRWKDNVDSVSDIQYSKNTPSSYNITQDYTGTNVRTQQGQNYQREYDADLEHTVWHL